MSLPVAAFVDGETAPDVKDGLNNLVAEFNAHAADTTDPHSVHLHQTEATITTLHVTNLDLGAISHQIRLDPDYKGSVWEAAPGGYYYATTNTPYLTSRYEGGGGRNYYEVDADSSAAAQAEVIGSLKVGIPADFTYWPDSAAVQIVYTTDDDSGDAEFDVYLYLNGALVASATDQSTGTAAWTTLAFSGATLGGPTASTPETGDWAAGDVLTLEYHLRATSAVNLYLAETLINYVEDGGV